jgi:hypothetical protein
VALNKENYNYSDPKKVPNLTVDGNLVVGGSSTAGSTSSGSSSVGGGAVAQTTEPTSPTAGLVWVNTAGNAIGSQLLRWRKAAAGGSSVFTGFDDSGTVLQYTPGYEEVFINGILLVRSLDYTASTGSSITLIQPLVTGDVIEIFNVIINGVTNTYTQAQSDAKYVAIGGTSPISGGTYTSSGSLILGNNNNGSANKLYLAGADTNHSIYSTGSGGNSMYFNEYGTFNWYNTQYANTYMVLDASGNLGINLSGTGNGAVMQKLDVQGNINMNTLTTTSGRKGTYQIGVGDAGIVGQKAAISFNGESTSTYGLLTNITFSNFNGDFYNSGLLERFRIHYNGNIGVNNATPTFKFDVATGASVTSTIGNQAQGLRLSAINNNTSVLEISETRMNNAAGTNWNGAGWRLQQKIDSTWQGWMQFNGGQSGQAAADYGITWGVGGGTSLPTDVPEVMRLVPTGGIGYLLLGYYSSNGSYRLQVNSQIFATSSSIATSDAKYKENIKELKNGLTLINSLRPVEFDWKEQESDVVVDGKVVREKHNFPEGRQVGFIAQDVEEAFKDNDWVSSIVAKNARAEVKGSDGETLLEEEPFLGLAETHIIPILVSAVKELSAKVESLEAKLNDKS